MKSFEKFIVERQDQNEIVMKYGKKNLKRFFNIDHNIYETGALPKNLRNCWDWFPLSFYGMMIAYNIISFNVLKKV
ncbi:MAG: hypothetical protein U9P79_00720 [Candidatus Cloacimonadota bacterium]|nr:hypothetical protein [Candidatus Cloacimonadota bacterium]